VGVPECTEETLGDVVPNSRTHSPGRGEGALPPRNDVTAISDAHVQQYIQSHIFDLYSVGTHEGGRKSVPFIQQVRLQRDMGEAVEEDAIIDDGMMANAIDSDTYEAARQQLGELAWMSRVLWMANGELVPLCGMCASGESGGPGDLRSSRAAAHGQCCSGSCFSRHSARGTGTRRMLSSYAALAAKQCA
jgi:hypothetical protein